MSEALVASTTAVAIADGALQPAAVVEVSAETVAQLLEQQARMADTLARLIRVQERFRQRTLEEALEAAAHRPALPAERVRSANLEPAEACRLLGLRASTARGRIRALKRESAGKKWLIRLSPSRYLVDAAALETHIKCLPRGLQRKARA